MFMCRRGGWWLTRHRGGESETSKREECGEVDRSCIPSTFQKGTMYTPSSVPTYKMPSGVGGGVGVGFIKFPSLHLSLEHNQLLLLLLILLPLC